MKFNLRNIGTDENPIETNILGSYSDGKAFEFTASWSLQQKGEVIGKNSDGSDILFSGETEIFESVEVGDIIPVDWEFTKNSTSVVIHSSNPKLADTYEPMKSYLSPRLIISSDMYKDIQNHVQCTKQDLIEQTMHYTGKTWAYKGINGYTNDGNELYYEIPITVNYKTKNPNYTGNTTKVENSETETEAEKVEEFIHHKATQVFRIQCIPVKTMQRFRELYAQECDPKESEYKSLLENQ